MQFNPSRISSAIALALLSTASHAQTTPVTQLPEVVVSVSRNDATLAEMPQSTTIITQDDIQRSPAQTVDQLLRNIVGLNLSATPETSKDPTGQSLSMRGLGNVTVLVLLDGIPIMDPMYGTIQWFKAPLTNIDHIEVLRGGSVVWGNMAVGGVINIITKRPRDNGGTVGLTYGSGGSTELSATKNIKVSDALSVNIAIDQLNDKGYQLTPSQFVWMYPGKGPVTTYDSNAELTAYFTPASDLQGFARLGYHINNEEISYIYGDNRQVSPDLAASLTKTLADQSTITGNVWAQEVGFNKTNGSSCYFATGGTCASLTASSTPATVQGDQTDQFYTQYGQQTYHEAGVSSVYAKTFGPIWRDLQLGVDYRRLSTTDDEWIYAKPNAAQLAASAIVGTTSATVQGSGNQAYTGLFAQTRIAPWQPLLVTLAAREDRFTSNVNSLVNTNPAVTGGTSESKFDPSISARYTVNDDLSLRASINETFRGPGLNNTTRSYGSSTSTPSISNPALIPQDMLEREFGADYQRGDLDLSATYFLYSIRNAITTVSTAQNSYQSAMCGYFGASSCSYYANAGDERSQGVELEAKYQLTPSLKIDAGASLTDVVLTSTTTTTPINTQLTGTPRLLGNLGVTWAPSRQLQLYAQAHYIGKMNYAYNGSTTGYEMGSNTVFDASLRYHLNPSVDLTGSVVNLLNRTYTDSTWTYGQPYSQSLAQPRTAYAGVQVKF